MNHHLCSVFGILIIALPSLFNYVRAEQPPLSFQTALPSFQTVHEAVHLCLGMWYVDSLQDGAEYVGDLNRSLTSHYFAKGKTSSDATSWIVTNNASNVLYVAFKQFNISDSPAQSMVLDASLEHLGAKSASVTVGASTSEMLSGDVRVQSGWNTAIFEKYNDNNRTVYQNLLANMNSVLLSNDINQIICIGTSQGGVMTTMFASYLAATDMKDRNIQVITFGAPAPGNSNYQNFVNNMGNLAVWKLQNENDPVPFFGIYQQPGHSIRICPFDNGTVDFQVYYLQHGNATMGLAATPDHFFSKLLPRIMPDEIPFPFLPSA